MSSRRASTGFPSDDSETEKPAARRPTTVKHIDIRPLGPTFAVYYQPKPSFHLSLSAAGMPSNSRRETRDVTNKFVESIDLIQLKPAPSPTMRRGYRPPSGASESADNSEDLKVKLESSQKALQASLRSCKEPKTKFQESKVKEDALINKITRAEVGLAKMTTLCKDAARTKQQVVVERDDAVYAQETLNLQVKKLEKNSKELQTKNASLEKILASNADEVLAAEVRGVRPQIASENKSGALEMVFKKLQDSETNRGILVRQVEQLMVDIRELSKERGMDAKFAKNAQDAAAAYQEAVKILLKELDGQPKTGAFQIRQLKEELKTVCGEKVAFMFERENEIVRMSKEMQRLLLENAELKKEVKLYREDDGVIVLDE